MNSRLLFYLLVTGILGAGIWYILDIGELLQIGKYTAENTHGVGISLGSTWREFTANLKHPLAILLLQILIILTTARLLGALMVKIGQPTVIGEIIAGILLGPSLLGWISPSFSAFLFPVSSIGNLQFLSQVGLILFMFVIGMELDLKALRKTARDAIVVSHAGIIFPYFLGVLLAYFLYKKFSPDSVSFLSFALFMGISMSITAFPVLARIVQERGLTRTSIGALVLAAAAADDVTAWCLLAVVIAIAKASSIGGAILTIIFSSIYIIVMLYVVMPFLDRIGQKYAALETLNKPIVAIIFLILISSAYTAELIGIHALFGAFLAGVVMPPRRQFRHIVTNKIEDTALVLFLPLFFVVTGLRTQIGLLGDPYLWRICLIIIATAISGKFLGSLFAAKWIGQSWYDSFRIGALMNTRGLMELVVLNIGYDLGILSPSLFAMLVLMALFTTFMTGPSLALTDRIEKWLNPPPLKHRSPGDSDRVLIAFAEPTSGDRLLQLACGLQLVRPDGVPAHALHCTPSADILMANAEIFEKESFAPILRAAAKRDIQLETHYRATHNPDNEIIQVANSGDYSLLLIGSSRPLFADEEGGGTIKGILNYVKYPVAIMIDRGFTEIRKVLVIVDEPEDLFLLHYLRNFAQLPYTTLTVRDDQNVVRSLASSLDLPFSLLPPTDWNTGIQSRSYDVLVVTSRYWDASKEDRLLWAEFVPSLMIVT